MLFLVENDGVLILSGKEPAGEEIKTADKNSVTAGNNADILNVNGGLVKLSNLTLKDSKTAAIIANSAVFQAINASFANMNNGTVKNAGNASFSGKNDFVNNSVAAGNGGALNLEKNLEQSFLTLFYLKIILSQPETAVRFMATVRFILATKTNLSARFSQIIRQ